MTQNFLLQIEEITIDRIQKAIPPSDVFLKGLPEVWLQRYNLPGELAVFKGHFTGNPILPALAQVILARDTAKKVSGQDLSMSFLSQAKFLTPVSPGGILSVYAQAPVEAPEDWRFHLTMSRPGDEMQLDAAYLKIRLEAARHA